MTRSDASLSTTPIGCPSGSILSVEDITPSRILYKGLLGTRKENEIALKSAVVSKLPCCRSLTKRDISNQVAWSDLPILTFHSAVYSTLCGCVSPGAASATMLSRDLASKCASPSLASNLTKKPVVSIDSPQKQSCYPVHPVSEFGFNTRDHR